MATFALSLTIILHTFDPGRTVLYVDIPTSADILALTSHQGETCVSIYLRTTPVTQETGSGRFEPKNLAKQAVHRLHVAEADKLSVAQLGDLVDDGEFRRFQANSLAIVITPKNTRTFRVPNALAPMVVVSNRFHVKPLFRAVKVSQTCYVLALAQRSARLLANAMIEGNRAATFGAVQTLLVDVPGQLDQSGAVIFAGAQADPLNYDLVDEIAVRVIATNGRIIGLRRLIFRGVRRSRPSFDMPHR